MSFIDAVITWLASFFVVATLAISTFLAPLFPVPPAVPVEEVTHSQTSETVVPIATSTTTKPGTTASTSPTASADAPILVPKPAPSAGVVTLLPEAQVNASARGALVNILCSVQGGNIKPITGSGIVIDSRGIILTNAHIGQFFLLKDYPTVNNVDCVVRTGSPAENRYRATLMYIPPKWVADNASQLTAAVAMGTGERDYAFLVITSTTDPNATLPSSFPYLPLHSGEPDLGESMLLASYPAGFLSGQIIAKSLYASSARAAVIKLYSFNNTPNIDLVSIGGTVVSQAGSSGGAVVRMQTGALTGIIATASVAESTAERDLRAVTVAHINRDLAADGYTSLASFLSLNAGAQVSAFEKNNAPGLRNILYGALNR